MVKLLKCLETYIFMDLGMKENNMEDIIRRVSTILNNRTFQNWLNTPKRNGINKEIKQIIIELIVFLEDVARESIIAVNS